MLKGLQGSGKSFWAKEQVKRGGFIRISKDDIRENLFGGWSQKREKDVIKIRNTLIREGLAQGRSVIVDDTNLNPKHEKVLRELAEECGVKFEINDSFLEVPIAECIKRDANRGDKTVGAKVIWETYERYLAIDPLKKLEKEFDKRRCVIFDMDGTLAFMRSGRSPYDYTRVNEDTPNPFLTAVIDALYEQELYYLDVVVVSGREESCRKETEKWLYDNMIPYDKLFMRKEGDHRDDVIVKKEIYENEIEPKYAVLGVFDDRPKVCDMWRSLGIMVAQVGNPHVEF